MLPDIEIARAARLRPIEQVAEAIGVGEDHLERYGRYKAKVSLDFFHDRQQAAPGRLILVSAINPTPAGEGKTTTAIGLADALNRIGKRSAVCLREPSLGPCFGMKGGATGGGYSQVAPMEDINLHFTGDFHAIGTAHNLLAALLDNHIHHGNRLDIDPRRIVWKRVVDMNDRALRDMVIGLGGTGNSFPRETGFDITVASEVMACLCLRDRWTVDIALLMLRCSLEIPSASPIANDGSPVLSASFASSTLLKVFSEIPPSSAMRLFSASSMDWVAFSISSSITPI